MAKRSFAGRAVEWFWGGAAMAGLRASRPMPSPQVSELNRRARVAIELGRQALEPPHPFENGPVDALVCQLFAQAAYWALLAQRAQRDAAPSEGLEGAAAGVESPPAAAPPADPDGRHDLAALMAQADPEVLARAAGTREGADQLAHEIATRSFVEYAALPPSEQGRLARNLLPFVEGLSDEVDSLRGAVERLWVFRVLRLGLLVATLGGLVWLVNTIADKREQARDLARGRPWVASSRYPEFGCTSPAQECPNSDIYFFATADEDNPKIEWDLGEPKSVSGVRATNRSDCCSDRAVPLVVEVSLDHTNWKEVARRNEDFSSWKATFPSVKARWVRLRVARHSLFHLTSVRILR
jgi:hypothetical protein